MARLRRDGKGPDPEGDRDQGDRARVFLNYRRDDASAYALLLYEALRTHFGDNVFMDIETLSPGLDFVDVINETLDQCDVVLALIGRTWLNATDAAGRRRLENPEDFVRLEIEAALARNVRVVPVLVGRAVMPGSHELPGELARLARRHAFELSDVRWHTDTRALIDAIDRPLVQKQRERDPSEIRDESIPTGVKSQLTAQLPVVDPPPEAGPTPEAIEESPRIPIDSALTPAPDTPTIPDQASDVAPDEVVVQPIPGAVESSTSLHAIPPIVDPTRPALTFKSDDVRNEMSDQDTRSDSLSVEAPEWQAAKARVGTRDSVGHQEPPDQATSAATRSRRRQIAMLTSGAGVLVVLAVVIIALVSTGGPAGVAGRGTTVPTIPVGRNTSAAETIPVGKDPRDIAITPDGKTAYVADNGGGNVPGTVTPIDVASDKASAPIPLGQEGASAIAITRDGTMAYVASPNGTVTPINVATGTSSTPITVGGTPIAIAIIPDGKTAYVVNSGSTVTPVDLTTGTASVPITIGNGAQSIAITPDGKTAYVAESGGDANGEVTPIDLATGTVGTAIAVGLNPAGLAITPNGTTAYVANAGDGTVTPIDVATDQARAPIRVGSNPRSIAISADGTTAYVANAGLGSVGTVTPIDVATDKAGTPITAGITPTAIAITPDGKTAYVTNPGDLDNGHTVTKIELAGR